MINLKKLEDNFYPVDIIKRDFIRCTDELNDKNIHTYVGLRNGKSDDVIMVSDDHFDDKFAHQIFKICPDTVQTGIVKQDLFCNNYGFTHIIFADHNYFSDLNGRLDNEKKTTFVAIPVFKSEFSGNETPEDFYELRRNIVPSNDWHREPSPKLLLRFDNTKTRAGTGDRYVLSKFDLVIREAKEMLGTIDSFMEILNYKNRVLELLITGDDEYDVIFDRDDSQMIGIAAVDLEKVIWQFLNE